MRSPVLTRILSSDAVVGMVYLVAGAAILVWSLVDGRPSFTYPLIVSAAIVIFAVATIVKAAIRRPAAEADVPAPVPDGPTDVDSVDFDADRGGKVLPASLALVGGLLAYVLLLTVVPSFTAVTALAFAASMLALGNRSILYVVLGSLAFALVTNWVFFEALYVRGLG